MSLKAVDIEGQTGSIDSLASDNITTRDFTATGDHTVTGDLAVGGDIGATNVNATGDVSVDGMVSAATLTLDEVAAPVHAPAAGTAQVWIRNTDKQLVYTTDDAVVHVTGDDIYACGEIVGENVANIPDNVVWSDAPTAVMNNIVVGGKEAVGSNLLNMSFVSPAPNKFTANAGGDYGVVPGGIQFNIVTGVAEGDQVVIEDDNGGAYPVGVYTAINVNPGVSFQIAGAPLPTNVVTFSIPPQLVSEIDGMFDITFSANYIPSSANQHILLQLYRNETLVWSTEEKHIYNDPVPPNSPQLAMLSFNKKTLLNAGDHICLVFQNRTSNASIKFADVILGATRIGPFV